MSGTRWSLVSFGGSPVMASESTSMNFEKGRLSGSDGCNLYSTSYVASENRLKIEPKIIGTRRACAQPVMEEAKTFIERSSAGLPATGATATGSRFSKVTAARSRRSGKRLSG